MSHLPPGSSADERAAELLRRWQDGADVEALDELLRHEVALLRSRVLGRFQNLLRPSTSATDTAQEAVLKWLQTGNCARFPALPAFRAYLLTVAWRLLVRRLRQPGRRALVVPADSQLAAAQDGWAASASHQLRSEDRRTALDLGLNLLRPSDQEILRLHYFDGLDHRALAVRLELEEPAVRKRLQRARRALAEHLRRWESVLA